jgi:hypothetical protein
MNKLEIVERLRIIYENIEHLLDDNERYDDVKYFIEDLIEEIEQDIIHGDEKGEDEED